MNEDEQWNVAIEAAAQIADAFQRGQQQMGEEEGWDDGLRAGYETAGFIAAAIRRKIIKP